MAAKAVDARKRFTRNDRCRGHGPLLQRKRGPIPGPVMHPRPCRSGPWPRKRWMQGNASPEMIAFAGMARSYKESVARYRDR
jgi:alkanesulfonate monooxygenase SsuD/methylene tetrahydromethanopterin reductase-like flavin-dependent oxidoreductase (luciferase family)